MKVLITGSSSGLGKALVTRFMAAGQDVQEFDTSSSGRDQVQRPPLWLNRCMTLDLLINCAGINSNNWFEDLTQQEFYRVMGVNAWGIVAMTQALLPALAAAKGTVINIVSNAAHIPMTSSLAYNASKAAALMITKQMAHELTPKHGITVFSVSPNKLEGTGMSKQIEANVLKTRGWTPEYAKEYQRKALMHGLETPPEEVAEFIYNLMASGNHQYLSGCDLPFGK